MRFSVIVPVHNNADTVTQALESIRSQEVPATEVIVIDDASNDNSAAVATGTGVPDRVLTVAHRNAAAARNTGVDEARCEWVAFLDADNIWMRDHLAIARELLEAGGDGVFCSPPLGTDHPVGENKAVLRVGHPLAQPRTGLTSETFIHWRLKYGWGFPTTGTVMSRAVAERIGGFDVTQVKRHDFELVLRAIRHSTWCATPLGTWWSRPTSPGDISSDEVSCTFYALRALQLNETRYSGRTYRRLIARAAYQAINRAQRYGGGADVARAMEAGWRHLSAAGRLKVLLKGWR